MFTSPTMLEMAKEALDLQDAVNLVALANGFPVMIKKLKAELQALKLPTDTMAIRHHPIVHAWVSKFVSLTSLNGLDPDSTCFTVLRTWLDIAKANAAPADTDSSSEPVPETLKIHEDSPMVSVPLPKDATQYLYFKNARGDVWRWNYKYFEMRPLGTESWTTNGVSYKTPLDLFASYPDAVPCLDPDVKPIVHVVMENEGGDYGPVLTTCSKQKAQDRYLKILKDSGLVVTTTVTSVYDFRGFKFGQSEGREVVQIDGRWYTARDELGDCHALWFECEVED